MIVKEDIGDIAALVLIVILTIVCVVGCLKIYLYQNLGSLCMKFGGGDANDTAKVAMQKILDYIKTLWKKIKPVQTYIKYFAKSYKRDPEFFQHVLAIIGSFTNHTFNENEQYSLSMFCDFLGTRKMLEATIIGSKIGTEAKQHINTFQMLIKDVIPHLKGSIKNFAAIKDLIKANLVHMRAICKKAIELNWVSDPTTKEALTKLTDVRFAPGVDPVEVANELLTIFMDFF